MSSRLAATGISPNAISTFGLVVGILGALALVLTRNEDRRTAAFLAAAILIPLRLLANMLDGMVAVERGLTSRVGELYNEVPDRLSDAVTLIGAGYAWGGGDPALGYIAAAVALFVAYVRAQGRVSGADQQFCGPMSKPNRMFTLCAAAVWAGLATRTWQPDLDRLVPGGEVIAAALLVIIAGGIVTAARRLIRITRQLRDLDA